MNGPNLVIPYVTLATPDLLSLLARGHAVVIEASAVLKSPLHDLVMVGQTLCQVRKSRTQLNALVITDDQGHRLTYTELTTVAPEGFVYLVPLVTT